MLRTIQSFALDRLAHGRHRSRRSSAPCRGLPRPRDPGESSAEYVPSQRVARSHGARAGQPSSGGAVVDRCRGGGPRPSSDRGPVAVLAGLRTGGRWSSTRRGGAGHARGSDQRIRPRVGAGCGREVSPTGRPTRRRPVAITRLRSTSPRRPATRRASPMRTSTSAMSRSAPMSDEGAQLAYIDAAEERYRKLGDERGAARAAWGRGILALSSGQGMLGIDSGAMEEAMDHLGRSLADFERLDDRQYHAMTEASLAWAAFAAGDVGTRLSTGGRRARRIPVDARPRDDDDLAPYRGAAWRPDRSLRGSRRDPRRLRRVVRALWRPPARRPRAVRRRPRPVRTDPTEPGPGDVGGGLRAGATADARRSGGEDRRARRRRGTLSDDPAGRRRPDDPTSPPRLHVGSICDRHDPHGRGRTTRDRSKRRRAT